MFCRMISPFSSHYFWRGLAVLTIFFVARFSVYAQFKQEREFRIRAESAPVAAQDFVAACQFESKVKWYWEEDVSSLSIEAKVRHQGRRYSIEFDTSGRLQDVEVRWHMDDLPSRTRTGILNHLETAFARFRIGKVQEQWIGPEPLLRDLIKAGEGATSAQTNYELIVRGRQGSRINRYEYLFDAEGSYIRHNLILSRNTDNLDF